MRARGWVIGRFVGLVLIAVAGGSGPLARGQGPANTSGFLAPPKAMHYDQVKDEIRVMESALSPSRTGRPGGDVAYYGSRLDQFRYTGPAKTGGIYEAMADFKTRRGFDPKNYQYRWR